MNASRSLSGIASHAMTTLRGSYARAFFSVAREAYPGTPLLRE
jgi:hypothetical protein